MLASRISCKKNYQQFLTKLEFLFDVHVGGKDLANFCKPHLKNKMLHYNYVRFGRKNKYINLEGLKMQNRKVWKINIYIHVF